MLHWPMVVMVSEVLNAWWLSGLVGLPCCVYRLTRWVVLLILG